MVLEDIGDAPNRDPNASDTDFSLSASDAVEFDLTHGHHDSGDAHPPAPAPDGYSSHFSLAVQST